MKHVHLGISQPYFDGKSHRNIAVPFQVLSRASFGKWDWVAETLDAGHSEVFRFERYEIINWINDQNLRPPHFAPDSFHLSFHLSDLCISLFLSLLCHRNVSAARRFLGHGSIGSAGSGWELLWRSRQKRLGALASTDAALQISMFFRRKSFGESFAKAGITKSGQCSEKITSVFHYIMYYMIYIYDIISCILKLF